MLISTQLPWPPVVHAPLRIRITTPGWAHGLTGTARPAFKAGHYHVTFERGHTEYLFDEREFEVLSEGQEPKP